MKHLNFIMLLLAAIAPFALKAQAEADTLAVVQRPDKVIVTVSEGRANVEVLGSQGDRASYYAYNVQTQEDSIFSAPAGCLKLDFPFSSRGGISRSSLRILKNIYAGGLLPVSSAEGIKGSWEIGVAELVGYGWQPSPRGPEFSVGVGFGFSELRLSGDKRFAKQGQRLAIVPAAENETKVSSGFRMWSMKFPLMLTQNLISDNDGDNGFGFSIGVVLNLNLNATAYSQAWREEVRYKQTFDGLHQHIFTADLMASVGMLDAFGVYVKYSPMRLMQGDYGPKMSTISVGGIINF